MRGVYSGLDAGFRGDEFFPAARDGPSRPRPGRGRNPAYDDQSVMRRAHHDAFTGTRRNPGEGGDVDLVRHHRQHAGSTPSLKQGPRLCRLLVRFGSIVEEGNGKRVPKREYAMSMIGFHMPPTGGDRPT